MSAIAERVSQVERAEELVKLLASFKDPRTCSNDHDELEVFANIINDAKEIYGDLYEGGDA